MSKRRLLIAAVAVLVLVVGFVAAASVDRCGTWPSREPQVTMLARGQGPLQVGAAKVDFALPFPLTVGGYGPPRPDVEGATLPLSARALVLDVGNQRLALVSLEVLLISPQLRDAIGAQQPFPVWVMATHTHSGPGGYAPSAAAEYAALGTFDVNVQTALADAARAAVKQATAKLAPAKLEVGDLVTEGVTTPRTGKDADRRLLRLRFDGEAGPLAQLLVLSAHPTLTPRKPSALHPDWPGVLATTLEAEGGPVTLVLQGAGGNASVNRAQLGDANAFAERVVTLVRALPTRPEPDVLNAAWSEVTVALPRPDARAVVPAPFRAAVENAVCDDAEDVAVLHALKLGEVRLLFAPVEPTYEAGRVLEQQAAAQRVVSLADGYAGYVELMETARAGEGESHHQYFPPELLERLAAGARLAGETTR